MFAFFLRSRLRNRAFLFWCMVFPLALMMCFHLAFGNMKTAEDIETFKTTVIRGNCSAEFVQNFDMMMDVLSEEGEDGSAPIFAISEFDNEDEAAIAMREGEIDLVFKLDSETVEVLFAAKHTTAALAVGRTVADTFMQNYNLLQAAFEISPAQALSLISEISEDLDFVEAQKSDFVEDDANPYIWYYYSSFVMGIMFNALSGVEIVGDLKADVGITGLRISTSPVKKSRLIAAAYLSSLFVALVINAIQLAVMRYVFGVPLGNSLIKLALFVIACNLFALAFGVLCGAFLKGNIDSRANKASSIIMTSVFLSGEMVSQLPGFLEKYCPIINDINPATVMNMALFRLGYSTGDFDLYINLTKISVMAFLFLVISVIILRREKYASV